MNRIKQLALCGVVMTLGASGFAYAQTATPPAPPAATAPADTDAAMPNDTAPDAAMPDGDMQGDAMAGDDDDDVEDADVRPMPGPGGPAEESRRGSRGPMGWLDTNKDGTIDKAEFEAGRMERLQAADANGDGTLSEDELEAMVLKQMAERRAAKLMKRLDIDGDGVVTLAESQGMRDKRFAVLDLNNDGKIDARELREAHRGVGPGMHGHGKGGHDRGERHHGKRHHGERHHGERHEGGREHGKRMQDRQND